MDGSLDFMRGGTLFAEDFDLPEATPEPEVIEPVYSASDVSMIREMAWRDGHAAGLQEASAANADVTREAAMGIAAQFAEQSAAATAHTEQLAEAIARLLFDSLAATFPALCVRYGDAEVRSIVRLVLPTLTQEPAITVRAHPRTAVLLRQEIARLELDLAAHVQTVECDAMSPGDVRIGWHNGSATRDAAALWQQVADILVPAGLLRADATVREMVNGI